MIARRSWKSLASLSFLLAVVAAGCGLTWQEPVGKDPGALGNGGSGPDNGSGASNSSGSGATTGGTSGSGGATSTSSSSASSSSSSSGGGAAPAPACGLEEECEDCIACADAGACAALYEACVQDAACAAARECISSCFTTDCLDACVAEDPAAAQQYLALADCVICDTCAETCGFLAFLLSCEE